MVEEQLWDWLKPLLIGIGGASIGGFILLLVKNKLKERSNIKFTLEKFIEQQNWRIRIQNQGHTIEGCTVLCEKEVCKWWDNSNTKPRHIHPGGGANAILPDISGFTNPIIVVKSYNKILKKIRLNDIVQAKQ